MKDPRLDMPKLMLVGSVLSHENAKEKFVVSMKNLYLKHSK